jgi:hypothetical protein
MRVHERAAQIWPLLMLAAANRQTLTYEQLGWMVGVPAPGLGQLLEPIQSLCLLRHYPPLTALVVGKHDGAPGAGFIAAADAPKAQAQVFLFNWRDARTPTADDFATALRDRPSNGIATAATDLPE